MDKRKGFTLIELLIVVAVVGILAGIAYPSWRDYIARGRRTDGKSALLDLANRMERYYSQQNTYLGATLGSGGASDVRSSNLSPEGWYTLSLTNLSASTYTLNATPRNAQATDDSLCQTLTLTNLGIKGIANGPGGTPSGSVTQCW